MPGAVGHVPQFVTLHGVQTKVVGLGGEPLSQTSHFPGPVVSQNLQPDEHAMQVPKVGDPEVASTV